MTNAMTCHVAVLAVALSPLFASHTAKADADLRSSAGRMLSAMEGDAHHVATLLRNARAARAPGPIKCVDGFLSQIDAGVRHGRDDLADIRSATLTGDDAAARRALGSLASRREAARIAAFGADVCASPAMATTQDHTVVHVIVDPKLPTDHIIFTR